MTSKIAKYIAVIALSAGLVATSANTSRAGDLDPLFGGLIGGGIGAGVGYAAGNSKGAMIGGILGAGLGTLIAAVADQDDHRGPRREVYPQPTYAAPPVYRPAPYPATYQPNPYQPARYAQTYCRQYETTVFVHGRPRPSYGTACLQPNGTWRVVD